MSAPGSRKLPVRMVEKPWGRDTLPAPFAAPTGQRIGEIWFEPPPELPQLLVKYIFTSEKLSVQVHPSDTQTEAAGLGRQGKEECWLIIAAEPGATIGVGFHQDIGADALRVAALDGSIEQLLHWYPVAPGDFFMIPANTVHAIGAGVSLIEVQQNSDITYRLYDYGRPRELHLDQAIAVAKAQPYAPALHRQLPPQDPAALVQGPLFRLDRVVGQPSPEVAHAYADGALLVVPLTGDLCVGGTALRAGECGIASGLGEILFSERALCLIAQPC
jgi:mannose-6-phosphate isomerase